MPPKSPHFEVWFCTFVPGTCWYAIVPLESWPKDHFKEGQLYTKNVVLEYIVGPKMMYWSLEYECRITGLQEHDSWVGFIVFYYRERV